MEFPIFGQNEPKYASWADEMDEVDPILPTTIKEDEPVYASWADEMDEVDPILPIALPLTVSATVPISTMLPTIYEEDEDEDEDESVYDDVFSDDGEESIETNDSEQLGLDAPNATELGKKKIVRFAEWKNEVFEVPADKDARKIADLRYLYPRWEEEEEEDTNSGYDDDDDDEEEEF